MDREEVIRKKKEIEERFGGWTSHNIRLADDLYTYQIPFPNRPGKPYTEHEGVDPRVRRVLQIVSDVTGEPFEKLRVLDLACLEGAFAVELALHGAKVLAMDIREANIEMTRFAKEVHRLNNLDLALEDVRKLSKTKYGSFDVVLCLGILYHLDAPSLGPFMERVSEVCQRVAIVDTHISLVAKESFVWNGKTYWGRSHPEHDPSQNLEERLKQSWMSLDNDTGFCFTRRSLYNFLRHLGFTSVYECHNPMDLIFADRITLVAIKGNPVTVKTMPLLDAPEVDWCEIMELFEYPELNQDVYPHCKLADAFDATSVRTPHTKLNPVLEFVVQFSAKLLPRPVKTLLKKVRWVQQILNPSR